MEYTELLDLVNNDFDIKIRNNSRALSMVDHENPVCITEKEFNFITDFIIKHNLKTGYECATAFGVSALAAGLGFKKTGGKLVTMDAYIEEQYNDAAQYNDKKQTYENADGYRLAYFLLNYYEVPVAPKVGWSPDNVEQVIKEEFGDNKIEYAFIDALHNDDAFVKDINAIKPFLAEKFVLFVHDVWCFSEYAKQFFFDTFGEMWTEVFPRGMDNYGLSYISNLE